MRRPPGEWDGGTEGGDEGAESQGQGELAGQSR